MFLGQEIPARHEANCCPSIKIIRFRVQFPAWPIWVGTESIREFQRETLSLDFPFCGLADLGRDIITVYRLWRVIESSSLTLSHINRFTVTPNTLSPFQVPTSISYNNSVLTQPHSDNFGNYLRRLALALASTFLYKSTPQHCAPSEDSHPLPKTE